MGLLIFMGGLFVPGAGRLSATFGVELVELVLELFGGTVDEDVDWTVDGTVGVSF